MTNKRKNNWLVERAREPSTYQGLSVLAGLAGSAIFGSSELGIQLLQGGLAVASLIQVAKKEPLEGRDY
jgi:hypothetical protein